MLLVIIKFINIIERASTASLYFLREIQMYPPALTAMGFMTFLAQRMVHSDWNLQKFVLIVIRMKI